MEVEIGVLDRVEVGIESRSLLRERVTDRYMAQDQGGRKAIAYISLPADLWRATSPGGTCAAPPLCRPRRCIDAVRRPAVKLAKSYFHRLRMSFSMIRDRCIGDRTIIAVGKRSPGHVNATHLKMRS